MGFTVTALYFPLTAAQRVLFARLELRRRRRRRRRLRR